MVETITCPGCTASFPGSHQLLGKKVRCRKCKHEFRVTAPAATEDCGLEFLDDEPEDCGLEFFDDEPEPTPAPDVLDLAALDNFGPAPTHQAPQALLQVKYQAPKAEPIITWRRFWRYNAHRLLLLAIFSLGLWIVHYGYHFEIPQASWVIMGFGAFLCLVAVWAELEKHFAWTHEVRATAAFLYMVLGIIISIVQALTGAGN